MLHKKTLLLFFTCFFPAKEFIFLPNEINEKDTDVSYDHLL